MFDIYAQTLMTATRSTPRCIKVMDTQKRKWWQAARTKCVDLDRL